MLALEREKARADVERAQAEREQKQVARLKEELVHLKEEIAVRLQRAEQDYAERLRQLKEEMGSAGTRQEADRERYLVDSCLVTLLTQQLNSLHQHPGGNLWNGMAGHPHFWGNSFWEPWSEG